MTQREALEKVMADSLDLKTQRKRARQTGYRRGLFQAIIEVRRLKRMYPETMFPDHGTTPDAKAGAFARTLCSRLEAIFYDLRRWGTR